MRCRSRERLRTRSASSTRGRLSRWALRHARGAADACVSGPRARSRADVAMRRLRTAPRAPVAVAGILAMPLFFVGLMAMSLAVEKPGVRHTVKHGKSVTLFGDPTGT